ncbi:MAG: hypothetical protein WCI05_14690 [Myxococcales bacterium]
MSRLLAAILLLLALSLNGCRSRKPPPPPPTVQAATELAPASAPERLLAEIAVLSPSSLWTQLQHAFGASLTAIAPTVDLLVCSAAGLDPALGELLDMDSPAYGAVLENAGPLGFAIAVRVKDRTRLETVLAESGTWSDKEGLKTFKSRKTLPLELALAGSYLVLASTPADLEQASAFVVATLARLPPPTGAVEARVPRAALGTLWTLAVREWSGVKTMLLEQDKRMRDSHGGRPPDFGDPAALLAGVDAFIQRRLTVLADLDEARLRVEANDARVTLDVTLKPRPQGPAFAFFAAMRPGDLSPLRGVSADAAAVLVVRDDAAMRASDAADMGDFLERGLGPRLAKGDLKKLRRSLDGWAAGRGDWLTTSLVLGEGKSLAFRTPSENDAALSALRQGLELAERPGFREPLKVLLSIQDQFRGTLGVPGLGGVDVVTFRRPKGRGKSWRVGWLKRQTEARVVLTEGGTESLRAGLAPPRTLEDDPSMKRLFGMTDVTFAFLVQPARLEPGQGASEPAMLLHGRREGDGWIRVEVPTSALGRLARGRGF